MDPLYLETLRSRVLIFDGAMGTSIQQYDLGAEDFGGPIYEGCNDYLVITRPDVVAEVHRGFLQVGVDVLETDTFRSNRLTLREYQLQDRVLEINQAAAQLARRCADEFATSDRPRFVAGSIGPSGYLPSTNDPLLGQITYAELADVFREQAAGLLLGGVDVLLIETSQDILEVKAAVEGLKRAMIEVGRRVPMQVQVSLDTSGRMLLGTDITAVLAILESLGIDVIGLNCSTGPDYMREPIRYLTSHTRLPVSCIPNAGLPLNVDGCAIYPMKPVPMAEQLADFVTEFGVNVVGGCCGTTPEHLAELVQRVAGINPWANRPAESDDRPRLASAMRALEMQQEPPPLMVGERVNTLGSRKVKQLLLNDDYDSVLDIAREQVEGGAHALDIGVATTERTDEDQQMRRVVKLLQQSVEAPLVIDTTEPDVAQTALEVYPGRAVINSIHMENGRKKIETVVPMAKQHGAAMVAMCIDEQGQAETAERKFEVARKIYEIVVGEYGMQPGDLIFDTLVFPITTGQAQYRNAAAEVLAAIRRIKADLAGCFTILGISNVSFGLKTEARHILNSVFLHHAVEAGLDMAIVYPAHITPYAEISPEHRTLMDDLIFNRDEDALVRVIEAFENYTAAKEEAANPTEGMTVFERLHWRILHRKKDGIEADIDEAVATALTMGLSGDDVAARDEVRNTSPDLSQPEITDRHAVWVLNNVLLPAMKEVGDKFGAGELILPFVLQSAEAMKKAVARLESYLEKLEGATKGTVVLATVFGDVHDIGKNLVGTILSNNGYTVVDLGKQVPVNTIIDAAITHKATAVGLSALLVSTSKQMPIVVSELHKRGLPFPVLIGGAAINRRFGYRTLFPEPNVAFGPGVFYCTDAFEGLAVMEALTGPNREAYVADLKQKALAGLEQAAALAAKRDEMAAKIADNRSDVPALPREQIPTPPFWGATVVPPRAIAIRELWEHFDLETLYRLHWGGRGKRGREWDELLRDHFEPTLRRFQAELERSNWLDLGIAYGYFPAQSDGDSVIVYSPKDHARELFRWEFPRQEGRLGLCLADYVAAKSSGIMDVLPLQVVTAGPQATERLEAAQARGDYTEAYHIHGFTTELAEALAAWNNGRIRRELGLPSERGLRYAWGYPACPDLSQHEQLMQVLPAGEIGVGITSGYQLMPEQSTAALIIHHPAAIYFGTGERNREAEQAVREVLGDWMPQPARGD
ncbi:MAG TPA: homocysteine S-methyltransferase family protein [Ardenticatenaceae bacterium]|nr:homocysteine S-methyltransferase family protein [Ardenticatenaceae bacterium]